MLYRFYTTLFVYFLSNLHFIGKAFIGKAVHPCFLSKKHVLGKQLVFPTRFYPNPKKPENPGSVKIWKTRNPGFWKILFYSTFAQNLMLQSCFFQNWLIFDLFWIWSELMNSFCQFIWKDYFKVFEPKFKLRFRSLLQGVRINVVFLVYNLELFLLLLFWLLIAYRKCSNLGRFLILGRMFYLK